jgi:hypothetical protein
MTDKAHFEVIQEHGMQPGIHRPIGVKKHNCVGFHESPYVKYVDLTRIMECVLIGEKLGLTRIASLRTRIVGTRFGTLESIFRRSRAFNFGC